MLRIAITEDEPKTARRLNEYVDRWSRERAVEVSVTIFPNGMELVEGYRPVWDVILLDIEMPLLDGMSAARRIRDQDPAVVLIFITNMARYAIKGYEVDAMDFVLKPVEYPQLAMKLTKAVGQARLRRQQFLFLHLDGEKVRVPTRDILFIEVIDHKLHIHTAGGEYVTAGSLQKIEAELAGLPFFRCSHSFLVNLANVTSVRRETVLVGTHELPVSRPNRRELLQRLGDYLGGGLQ